MPVQNSIRDVFAGFQRNIVVDTGALPPRLDESFSAHDESPTSSWQA
jgi:hypothetical protein